ncbi:hypothetical protein V6N13_059222 [Hibiscus sabdariffa]
MEEPKVHESLEDMEAPEGRKVSKRRKVTSPEYDVMECNVGGARVSSKIEDDVANLVNEINWLPCRNIGDMSSPRDNIERMYATNKILLLPYSKHPKVRESFKVLYVVIPYGIGEAEQAYCDYLWNIPLPQVHIVITLDNISSTIRDIDMLQHKEWVGDTEVWMMDGLSDSIVT